MEIKEVAELLKSIRNRCDIGIILISLGREDVLPTVLEDLHVDSQTITFDYCVLDEINREADKNLPH